MSGPKRADVEAELTTANAAAKRAAGIVRDAQVSVLNSLRSDLSNAVGDNGSAITDAARRLDNSRADVPSVGDARGAVNAAKAARRDAEAAASSARTDYDEAARLGTGAQKAFDDATQALAHAKQVLKDSIGDHNKDREMALAKDASAQIKQATKLAKSAASARMSAQRSLKAAVTHARQADDAASSAVSRAKAAEQESIKRVKAEEEARRIAEQARQKATIAVNGASLALEGLPKQDCDKFAPGEYGRLEAAVGDAQRRLAGGDSDRARQLADAASKSVSELMTKVAAARAEFDRKRAAAITAIGELDATITASDGDLIGQWSDTSEAFTDAVSSLGKARKLVEGEDFDEATALASTHSDALAAATVSAAENNASNERRVSIGDAIMDVLEELNFTVSVAEGNKDEPLRIEGQSADVNGQGDVVLEIPLDGEVDFEVTASQGDGSCSATIAELRSRLSHRGVAFDVTDWGYGHEPDGATGQSIRRQREEQRVHTHTRTR